MSIDISVMVDKVLDHIVGYCGLPYAHTCGHCEHWKYLEPDNPPYKHWRYKLAVNPPSDSMRKPPYGCLGKCPYGIKGAREKACQAFVYTDFYEGLLN